jgi:uncharacterized protein YcaQ
MIDARHARRLVCAAQGLLRDAPFGRGLGGARRALEHLGYVQIDTISVVERAHHHVLHTRVPGYRTTHLDDLVTRGDAFEYWAHAAAYLPMRDFRFALPRMHAWRSGPKHWSRLEVAPVARSVLDRVRADGPVRARDFEDPRGRRAGWWDWKPAKLALELMFHAGELIVTARDGFEKVYDLPERALPDGLDLTMPDHAELAAHLLDNALRAHVFALPAEVTYLRKDAALRRALAECIETRIATGELVRVRVGDGRRIRVAAVAALDARLPAVRPRVRWLSPFDPAVIHRDRTRAVFGLDYQIECYVPAPKRRFGYFCLPMQWSDELVGRVDARAARRERVLSLQAVHVESPIADRDAFAAAFAAEARAFATFNGCDEVTIRRTSPGAWLRPLRSALDRS